MNLKNKIEQAVTAYLADVFEGEDLNIYPHHGREDEALSPMLIVGASDAQTFGDMPGHTGIKTVGLRLTFTVDSTEEETGDRSRLDDWQNALAVAMADTAAVIAYINPPDELPDDRTITDVYCYDVIPADEPDELDGNSWVEGTAFEIICQNGDPLSEA